MRPNQRPNKGFGKTLLGSECKRTSLSEGRPLYRIGRLLGVFLIRSFKLVDKEVFLLETEEDLEETIIGFYYSNPLPEVLLLNFELSEEVKGGSRKGGRLRSFKR